MRASLGRLTFGLGCALLCTLAGAQDPQAAPASAPEARLGEVVVLAVAAPEGAAVVRARGGEPTLVRAGEKLPGQSARVLEVLPDRLVLELEAAAGPGEPAARLKAWLFLERATAGRPRLVLLDPRPPSSDDLGTPSAMEGVPAPEAESGARRTLPSQPEGPEGKPP